jgi:hypothetical protein
MQGVTSRQDASVLRPGAQQQEGPDYNGADFTRPQRSIEFRPEYRTSSGPTSETDRWIEQLRYNAKLDLGGNWKLGYLLEVPIVEKTTTSFAPPTISRDAGLGGTFAQAALIHTINQNWAYGFGARLVAWGPLLFRGPGNRNLSCTRHQTRDQRRRRSEQAQHQRAADRSHIKRRPPRPLVYHLLPQQ